MYRYIFYDYSIVHILAFRLFQTGCGSKTYFIRFTILNENPAMCHTTIEICSNLNTFST